MENPVQRSLARVLLAGLIAACGGACGANLAPVLEVKNAPVALPAGAQPSPEHTRDAIVRGLAAKGWGIDSEAGPSIVASVSSGGHTGTVRIDYDANRYSIRYVSSSPSLKHDGYRIHRRFNHWVDRLRVAIQRELSSTAPPAAPAATRPAPVEPVEPDEELPPAPPPG
jgi:hypothetical protein